MFSTYTEEHYRLSPGIATCVSVAACCGAYLRGSSLGGQGDVKEVSLLWLNGMFISRAESLLAKEKSAVAVFSAEE